jgi:hypothetical protein
VNELRIGRTNREPRAFYGEKRKVAREAPLTVAFRQKEFIVQMIGEFQFLNAMIYWDKSKTNLADDMGAGC